MATNFTIPLSLPQTPVGSEPRYLVQTPSGKWVYARLVRRLAVERYAVRRKVAVYIKKHPSLTYAAIAAKIHCHPSTVSAISREFSIRVRRLSAKELEKLN